MNESTTEKNVNAQSTSAMPTNGKWISKESYNDLVHRGTDLLSNAGTTATSAVRDYPIQAAVGGLVIGFILGGLFFRRSSAV